MTRVGVLLLIGTLVGCGDPGPSGPDPFDPYDPGSGGESGIEIVEVEYGGSCGAPVSLPGLVRACEGERSCFCDKGCWEPSVDPAFGCAKDLRVTWRCDGGSEKTTYFPAEADEDYTVRLDCAGTDLGCIDDSECAGSEVCDDGECALAPTSPSCGQRGDSCTGDEDCCIPLCCGDFMGCC